jgi:small-conductance mechanosensitive channel
MRAWLDREGGARFLLAAAAILALLGFAGPAFVQGVSNGAGTDGSAVADEAPPPSFDAQFKATAATAQQLLDSNSADNDAIDQARAQLLTLRARAIDEIRNQQAALEEANKRLQALGPAPSGDAAEAPELAARRKSMNDGVAATQLALLSAQESANEIDRLTRELDREAWRRVTQELRAMGPSPLAPANWREAAAAIGEQQARLGDAAAAVTREAASRGVLLRTVPRSMAIIVIGIAITIFLRLRLTRVIENALETATRPRLIAWLVALRNLARLLVPAVGAALLIAVFDPILPLGGQSVRLLNLPPFILALIGAGWLASSLFAPRLSQYRLVPLSDADARRGARLTHLLGGVLAVHFFILNQLGGWPLTPAANSVLHFPLTLIGGWGLWRVSSLFTSVQRNVVARDALLPEEQHVGVLGLNLLGFLGRAVFFIGIAAPVLAAIGFFAASQTLLYPMILTLALFGANLVVFDLVSQTVRGVMWRRDGVVPETGLGPVVLVTALVLGSAPVLALIWGARPSDITNVWLILREGGSLGGIHLSLGVITSLLAVFLIGFALTRGAQSVLVSSVLPRTKLDVGGKTAVISGVGYLGYSLATLAAVSATGIDLSSIAIVAGALSVGIGFGLQTIVSNFVSGIILLVERPVKEGDWIEVGGFAGYVRRISVRATEIETFDRASVILPNSDLISGTVLNRTHTGMTGRVQVPVSVTYDTDPHRAAEILLEIAEDHPLVLQDPTPRVLLMNLGSDSIDFEIRVWLRDVNFSLSVRSDMNFKIVERLRDENIRMRFWGRELPPSEDGERPPDVDPARFMPPPDEAPTDPAKPR